MKFEISKSGFFTITDIADNEVILADFITGDIQSSISFLQEILESLDLRKNNKSYLWEMTGNAHTISITNKNIVIFNEFNENVLNITDFDYFEKTLRDWMSFILSHY